MTVPTAVRVSLQGCDDSTIWNMLVDEGELAFLRRLEEESAARSTYSCMPRLLILEGSGWENEREEGDDA